MVEIEQLKFDEKGLIPAVVVEDSSGQVLTLAYMNRESLDISMREGRTCFWSRSRGELWRKGETSGAVQHIIDITADCDGDALLVRVRKDGPACHTGAESCFHRPLYVGDTPEGFTLGRLLTLLEGRKAKPKAGSYTSYLFDKGMEKILKKVGEESTEVILAAAARNKGETIYEIADLTYHILVAMVELGITTEEIREELESRSIIDHKEKQEKPR